MLEIFDISQEGFWDSRLEGSSFNENFTKNTFENTSKFKWLKTVDSSSFLLSLVLVTLLFKKSSDIKFVFKHSQF